MVVFASDMPQNRGSDDAVRRVPSISASPWLQDRSHKFWGSKMATCNCRGCTILTEKEKNSCYEDLAEVPGKWPSFGKNPFLHPGLSYVASIEAGGSGYAQSRPHGLRMAPV